MKNWAPVMVLIVTISAQWLTVFWKMLDMQQEITTVRVTVEQLTRTPREVKAEKKKQNMTACIQAH